MDHEIELPIFLLGRIGKGWLGGTSDYNGSVVANVGYPTCRRGIERDLRVISMSDQPKSEEKLSSTKLYILGGMAILIVLMWFLTYLWW